MKSLGKGPTKFIQTHYPGKLGEHTLASFEAAKFVLNDHEMRCVSCGVNQEQRTCGKSPEGCLGCTWAQRVRSRISQGKGPQSPNSGGDEGEEDLMLEP